MNTSEKIDQVIAALVKAHAAIGAVGKDGKNKHLKYDYATINAFLGAISTPLGENGIFITQCPMDAESGKPILVTRILHTSGQWIESRTPLIVSKNDMQGLGSAITYARRYALQSMLLLGAEDDDGHASTTQSRSGRSGQDRSHTQRSSTQSPEISAEDLALIDQIRTRPAVEIIGDKAKRDKLSRMVEQDVAANAEHFITLVQHWVLLVATMEPQQITSALDGVIWAWVCEVCQRHQATEEHQRWLNQLQSAADTPNRMAA